MEKEQRKGRGVGFALWVSLTLLIAVSGLYVWQPDGAFALTIYSPWMPALLAVGLCLPTAIRRRSKLHLALVALWAVWGAFASEESFSLARSLTSSNPLKAARIRVISLNCAGGIIEAAREVIPYKPDIVLLQESPSAKELEALAREMYGEGEHLVKGPDASILSRYRLRSFHEGEREPLNYVGAYARTGNDGETWLLISLRLQPPVLRFDYWNPACWQAYAEGKAQRRLELSELMEEVQTFDDDERMVVGGDFNAPPDRSIHGEMQSRIVGTTTMVDAVKAVGTGWPLTAVNDYPLVRIDQIWLDDRFKPIRAFVVKTIHSDHRMGVTDFIEGG